MYGDTQKQAFQRTADFSNEVQLQNRMNDGKPIRSKSIFSKKTLIFACLIGIVGILGFEFFISGSWIYTTGLCLLILIYYLIDYFLS